MQASPDMAKSCFLTQNGPNVGISTNSQSEVTQFLPPSQPMIWLWMGALRGDARPG